jgi:hypothetical protein
MSQSIAKASRLADECFPLWSKGQVSPTNGETIWAFWPIHLLPKRLRIPWALTAPKALVGSVDVEELALVGLVDLVVPVVRVS